FSVPTVQFASSPFPKCSSYSLAGSIPVLIVWLRSSDSSSLARPCCRRLCCIRSRLCARRSCSRCPRAVSARCYLPDSGLVESQRSCALPKGRHREFFASSSCPEFCASNHLSRVMSSISVKSLTLVNVPLVKAFNKSTIICILCFRNRVTQPAPDQQGNFFRCFNDGFCLD